MCTLHGLGIEANQRADTLVIHQGPSVLEFFAGVPRMARPLAASVDA